jgi:Mce-associated membrane protein
MAEHADATGELSMRPDSTAESGNAEIVVLQRDTRIRLALSLGLVVVFALGAFGVWLGYRAYEGRQGEKQRALFIEVGRQGALNLTTINYTEAEADVRRILDSATGRFYDDFQSRSGAFIDVVQKAQSKTEGTVTYAGLESEEAAAANVLVAVTVKTSNSAAPEQNPRTWRMRIGVQRVGDGAKISNVEFVP